MADAPQLEAEIVKLKRKLADLTETRERELLKSRERSARLRIFEAAMELVPVGIVLADAKGRIYHGNSRVEEMLCHPVLMSDDPDSYIEWVAFHEDGRRVRGDEYPLARALRGEEDPELTCHYQRGDGTKFWMRINGQPLCDENGEIVGAAVALIDVDAEANLRAEQQILIRELNHRVKNAFTVVKSIVSQSLRKQNLPDGLRETIDSRLQAYARAHAKLVGSRWEYAQIDQIARDILPDLCGDRIEISGPEVEVPSEQALSLSMALYELATNAVKHGALSVPDGTVVFCWAFTDDKEEEINLSWVERGGPPAIAPTKRGFGTFIVDRAIAARTEGSIDMKFTEEGFEWYLRMPVAAAQEDA